MCFNVFGHCVTVRSSLLAVDSAAETITHPTNTLSHSLLIIEIMVDTGSVAIPNENLTSVKVDFEIVAPVTTMSVMAAVNADMIVPNLNDLEVAVGSTITDEIMSPFFFENSFTTHSTRRRRALARRPPQGP